MAVFNSHQEFKKKLITHLQYCQDQYLDKFLDQYKFVTYGTAGFRNKADNIEHILLNLGIFAGFYCIKSEGNIGLMITASHNPVDDNGVKIVEIDGTMLNKQFEPLVESICNTLNPSQYAKIFVEAVERFLTLEQLNQVQSSKVMIGIDTRPSSVKLLSLVKEGIRFWEGIVDCHDYGLVTTPLLHYLVVESNKKNCIVQEEVYFAQLSRAFVDSFAIHPKEVIKNYFESKLIVDCANGIGSRTMQALLAKSEFAECIELKIINVGEGKLNHQVGADYVKTTKLKPLNAIDKNARYACLDGDADRLIYFYIEHSIGDSICEFVNLLDGDKILTLIAEYLKNLMTKCNLTEKLSFGVIQTAYANGSSTDYLINNLNLKVDFVETGVKNLHHQAAKYDVGLYFEANGHGTVHLSEKAYNLFKNSDCVQLRNFVKILNSYVGDAISIMLLVETILLNYDWSIKTWAALYKDRPNSIKKFYLSNKSTIKTTNADRCCIEPVGLGSQIEAIVENYGAQARCFIRPSGTEDYVRVYSEASTQELADELANKVCEFVPTFFQNIKV